MLYFSAHTIQQVPMHDLLAQVESQTTALNFAWVANWLQISEETVRRMAAKKLIPSFKVGGQVRFNPASLGYWLRQRDPVAAKASKALKEAEKQGPK